MDSCKATPGEMKETFMEAVMVKLEKVLSDLNDANHRNRQTLIKFRGEASQPESDVKCQEPITDSEKIEALFNRVNVLTLECIKQSGEIASIL